MKENGTELLVDGGFTYTEPQNFIVKAFRSISK
jgi:hypothetical protein